MTLDQMYSSIPPVQGTPGNQATPWQPKKGIFQDNVQTPMGDYNQYSTPLEQYDRGMWKADPNVDYGQAPEQGMVPVFDKEGNHYGWEEPHSYSTGGMGVFGDMGAKAKTWRGYYYDQNGQLQSGSGGVTPSMSGATKFMSYAVPIGMAAGLGAGAAGGAFSGGAAVPGAGTGLESTAGLVELGQGGAGFTGSTAATGGATSLSALPGAGSSLTSGSFLEMLKEYGPKALELVAGGGTGGANGGSNGRGTNLLDLVAGYMGNKNLKDYAGNAKEPYSDAVGRQKPYLDQLLASYQDPNTFYNSNQWKGLESVYQNQIDRGAAKTGTNANPTAREVLLQNHAMKSLEDYRRGLTQAAGITNPAAFLNPYSEGIKAEASAGSQAGLNAALGRMRTGGGTADDFKNIIKTISDAGSTAEDIWNFVSKWFD